MNRLNKLTLIILGLLLVLSVTGCVYAPSQPAAQPAAPSQQEAQEAPVPQADTGEAITLSFWTRDSNAAQVRTLVEAWNATHKNQIEVTVIPTAEFVTKVGTAVAGGVGPDIMAIDLIYVPAFSAANQMTDITDLARALPYFDKLSPSHVRLATYQDRIYALPFNAEASVLLYNKGLFKQAGLDPEKPPTTWAEIADAAQKITALGDDTYGFYFSGACAGCNAFTLLPLIWASGGDVISEDGSQATLTDPAVKAALEFYRQMWEDGLIPPGAQVDNGTDFANAFQTGKIGIQGLGAFAISLLKNDHPEIEFGVVPLPGQNGGSSSFAGGDSVGIPAGSKHVAEAFEFIGWMTTEEVQLEQYAKVNSLPVRTDISENEYFAQDPRLTLSSQAMGTGRTPYSLHYNELFNDANGPWITMLQSAIFEGKIDESIATAQEKFTEILSQ